MIGPIAEMKEEIVELREEIDRIQVQLVERQLWRVKAKAAERIKLQQIMELQSGIATLKKQKKMKAHEATMAQELTIDRLIVKALICHIDSDIYQPIIDEIRTTERGVLN